MRRPAAAAEPRHGQLDGGGVQAHGGASPAAGTAQGAVSLVHFECVMLAQTVTSSAVLPSPSCHVAVAAVVVVFSVVTDTVATAGVMMVVLVVTIVVIISGH